jgi:hypothetical protein
LYFRKVGWYQPLFVILASRIGRSHTHDVSTKVIEKKLADLQRRVTSLEEAKDRKNRGAWRQIIGASKGQVLDREAASLGAQWRSKENKRK